MVHAPVNGVQTPALDGATVFPQHPVRLSRIVTLPDLGEPALADFAGTNRDGLIALDQAWRDLVGLGEEWPTGEPHHQLGGWPGLIQRPFWLEAHLASQGINLDDAKGYADSRAAALADGASSWRLLLQLDTDDRLGWMWGDVGRLFYLIRQDDLAAGEFTRCWLNFQCS